MSLFISKSISQGFRLDRRAAFRLWDWEDKRRETLFYWNNNLQLKTWIKYAEYSQSHLSRVFQLSHYHNWSSEQFLEEQDREKQHVSISFNFAISAFSPSDTKQCPLDPDVFYILQHLVKAYREYCNTLFIWQLRNSLLSGVWEILQEGKLHGNQKRQQHKHMSDIQ